MPRPVHFEIHADQPERAVSFYENVFAWRSQKWDGPMDYWLMITGSNGEPGIDGAVTRREGPANGDSVIAYVCTMDVPSLDGYVEKVESNGGQIVMPKMAVPGVGWLAYCKDTEGNIFGMIENDPAAH